MSNIPVINIETLRQKLFGIAMRLLRCHADAEDAVQDAFCRLQKQTSPVHDLEAWLVTTLTRVCLDRLRLNARRAAKYQDDTNLTDVISDDPALLADELESAFRKMLQSLSTHERIAIMLREAFGYRYAEIAAILKTSESNVRQLLHRAKRRLLMMETRFEMEEDAPQQLAEQFSDACRIGDLTTIETLFNRKPQSSVTACYCLAA
jgi:RNA polymerase sigma-70 factor, ECF subfamily